MSKHTKTVAHWINEREKIRRFKEAGNKGPWTLDPILGQYRFCNVHREDDKVTRWIAHNWRNPHATSTMIVAAMVLARTVNWPPTLRAIGFPELWNNTNIIRVIQEQHSKGKAWGSAYIVSTNGHAIEKALYVVRDVCCPVAKGWQAPTANTLRAYYDRLRRFNGLGSFMAGQIVADLKNAPRHRLSTAPDWWTWATPGPGSMRGLSVYWDLRVAPGNFLTYLHKMEAEVEPLLDSNIAPLCSQDWQNVMCEFSKYHKAKEGYGRPKSDYTPTPNFPDAI